MKKLGGKREASEFLTPVKKMQLKLSTFMTPKYASSLNDTGYDSPQLLPPSPSVGHVSATPPLCGCDRRSRKRQVYKVGPNTGRIFWSCPLKGRNTKVSCNFFFWATTD